MLLIGRSPLDIGQGADHRNKSEKKEKEIHNALLRLKGMPLQADEVFHNRLEQAFLQEGASWEEAAAPRFPFTTQLAILLPAPSLPVHAAIAARLMMLYHRTLQTGLRPARPRQHHTTLHQEEHFMIRVDLHTHTNHSHARDCVRQMFEAGQTRGLLVQGFSEHSPRPEGYDYPSEYREHLAATFEDYIREVTELREEQAAQGITVLLGLEVDWLEEEIPYLRRMISSHKYDYLIGGIHFLGRWGFDSSAEDWAKLSPEKKYDLYARYYRTMKHMAESRLFNIVAHPDLIKIFSADDFRRWLELPGSMEQVKDALSAVRDAGMAMEISAAGLRKPCREIYPGPKILRAARELGLPITFASDSHATEQVAWGFDVLAEYAAAEGWTSSLIFSRNGVKTLPF